MFADETIFPQVALGPMDVLLGVAAAARPRRSRRESPCGNAPRHFLSAIDHPAMNMAEYVC